MNKIEKTIKNLNSNNMDAYYFTSREQLFKRIDELIPDGSSVSCGGSMTLFEVGIIDHLHKINCKLLDRYKDGLSRDDVHKVLVSALTCDVYITSSNAVTENGELYNVDGNGNRVAAMIFGPKSVIVVIGVNKIVADIKEATLRVRNVAAPANAVRLKLSTPCTKTGHCMDCKVSDHICCNYVVMGQQRARNKGRIKVLILNEELGY